MFKLSILPVMWPLMAYLMVWTRKKEVYVVTGKHKLMETDNINYVQSSLKSRPLWVTLYFEVFDRNYFYQNKIKLKLSEA